MTEAAWLPAAAAATAAVSTPGGSPAAVGAAPFFTAAREGKLRLQRCRACGTWALPLRMRCQACGSSAMQWRDASGRGTIFSHAVLHRPYHPRHQGRLPLVLAQVDLAEGVRLQSNIVDLDADADQIKVGREVEVRRRSRTPDGQASVWITASQPSSAGRLFVAKAVMSRTPNSQVRDRLAAPERVRDDVVDLQQEPGTATPPAVPIHERAASAVAPPYLTPHRCRNRPPSPPSPPPRCRLRRRSGAAAADSRIPYQTLINLYLRECAANGKKLVFR